MGSYPALVAENTFVIASLVWYEYGNDGVVFHAIRPFPLYYGPISVRRYSLKLLHDIKAAALDKITDPCIIAVSGDISVKDHGAADFSGGSA